MPKHNVEYNGWVIFVLVCGLLCLDDIAGAIVIFSLVIYVVYIEYLKVKNNGK